FLLTFNIYWVFWTYATYRELRQNSPNATTITPGQAVGYLFIPLFNVYWFFRLVMDLPRALARVQRERAPAAEPLPSGRITALLIAAIVLNSLGGMLHPSVMVAGEVALITAFVVCQRWMNNPVAPAGPRRVSVAELVGAAGPGIDWGRAAAFAVASCISVL